jgi:tRNA threonylcarbamoyladenosine biosynthesis protein TsaB
VTLFPLRILALETSGLSGSVAALSGGKLLAQLSLNPEQRSAQSLAAGIQRLLGEVGWRPRDVQLVAVTRGPGSFTGLRIGVTTAKTFAYAVGAEVLGVDTLEVLADQAPAEAPVVQAVLDAQRQELFAATFRGGPSETRIVPIDTWLASLSPDHLVIGPVLTRLRGRLPAEVAVAPEATWTPLAATVGLVALRHYLAGQRSDLWQLTPLYLRRSAAEERLPTATRPT